MLKAAAYFTRELGQGHVGRQRPQVGCTPGAPTNLTQPPPAGPASLLPFPAAEASSRLARLPFACDACFPPLNTPAQTRARLGPGQDPGALNPQGGRLLGAGLRQHPRHHTAARSRRCQSGPHLRRLWEPRRQTPAPLRCAQEAGAKASESIRGPSGAPTLLSYGRPGWGRGRRRFHSQHTCPRYT